MKRSTKPPAPTAAQRTISMFTGKTDVEAPNARDGSDPDPEDRYTLSMRPNVKWKQFDGLRQYEAKTIHALIVVEKSKDGAWKYRAYRAGVQLGLFDSMSEAANAAEAA